MVKWVIWDIKGTLDVSLIYKWLEGVGAKLIGYVDTNYARDLDKMRSLIGYVFTLFGCKMS